LGVFGGEIGGLSERAGGEDTGIDGGCGPAFEDFDLLVGEFVALDGILCSVVC